MNIKSYILVLLSGLVLTACQSIPPANFSVPNVGLSAKKIDAELKSLTVSVARPDEKKGRLDFEKVTMDMNGSGGALGGQVVPQLWQTSLTESLNNMAIFQDDSSKKVNLAVKILKLEVPSVGISFTTNAIAKYEVMDRKSGDLIFSQEIASSGTTPGDFAFNGLARMRESINRAVQNNITQFLQLLETVDINKPMFPAKSNIQK